MKCYDVHAHCIKNQAGGILLGMDGVPYFDGTLTNAQVEEITIEDKRFLPAYYISKDFVRVPDERILKYHPRREKYSAEEVIADLSKRACKLCIIDTLNQPNWQPMDYWRVVAAHPDKLFLLPHVGGYDIVEFLKILDFNKNVYVDFSMTQEYFGWCGSRSRLAIVADGIDYCLNSEKLSKRVLFGSDEPFFSQELALQKYQQYASAEDVLVNNFVELKEKIQ